MCPEVMININTRTTDIIVTIWIPGCYNYDMLQNIEILCYYTTKETTKKQTMYMYICSNLKE